MSGTVVWSYYSTCLANTSNTFIQINFLIKYISKISYSYPNIIFTLLQFIIQFFISFFSYLFYFNGLEIDLSYHILYLPLLILQWQF